MSRPVKVLLGLEANANLLKANLIGACIISWLKISSIKRWQKTPKLDDSMTLGRQRNNSFLYTNDPPFWDCILWFRVLSLLCTSQGLVMSSVIWSSIFPHYSSNNIESGLRFSKLCCPNLLGTLKSSREMYVWWILAQMAGRKNSLSLKVSNIKLFNANIKICKI